MPRVRYVGLTALEKRAMLAIVHATDELAYAYIADVEVVTPIDEGTLKASIHVAEEELTGTTYEVTVATGAEASDYAIVQHEGFWVSGPLAGVTIYNHPGGGDDHYMEDPLLENYEVYEAYLAAAARAYF